MFADDEAKLAQMMADLERIRKLLRDSDRQAAQAGQQPAEIDDRQPANNRIQPDDAQAE